MKDNFFENMNILADAANSALPCIRRSLCDKKATCDISGEFVLPDYLPEMRKLVRVCLIPTAPSKFISGNAVQLGGGADYHICYVGADGKLYGTAFPTEYSFNAPFDPDAEYDADEGVFACADVCAESVVGRVIGARKIGLKARLSAKILALGGVKVRPAEWMKDPSHSQTQKLVKRQGCFGHLIGSNDEVILRDTVGDPDGGVRFISADCSAFIEEIHGGEGYADCRGTVKVRYLLCRENESIPYVLEKRYPLSETVELEGMKEGAPCTAYCVCTGVDAATGTDGGETECTVHMRILAQGFLPESVEYVSDAYSTVYDASAEKSTLRLPIMNGCVLRNMTYDTTLPLEKLNTQIGKGATVISVTASAATGEPEFNENGDKASVGGSVTFNILYSVEGDEGSTEIMSLECDTPFKIDGIDTDGIGKVTVCGATAFDPRAKIGANELGLGCELAISCAMVSEASVECVSEMNILGERDEKRGGISICYPGSEESVWSVAKKYRVAADRIMRENGISADLPADDKKSLENVKYLIV